MQSSKWICSNNDFNDYIFFYPDSSYHFFDFTQNEHLEGNYIIKSNEITIYEEKKEVHNSDGYYISYFYMTFIAINNKLFPTGRIISYEIASGNTVKLMSNTS